jgi:hypothetical protein
MRCVSCGFVRVAILAAFAAGSAAVTFRTAGAAALAPQEAREAAALASSLASAPAPEGLRAVWHEGSDDPASTIDRLQHAGFRVEIALPPHLFYVRESSRARALPAGYLWRETPAAAPAAAADADLDLFGGRDDILAPLAASGGRDAAARSASLQGMPFGARWRDTSEFMIGRVGIGILFPESDGSTDPNRYDWTPALRDSVVRSTLRGLAHWTAFAARRSIPLTFAIEVHAGLATRYEPIDRMAAEEDSWIQDVLTGYLGYKSDATTLAYDAANGVRSRLGASWGALLFAVQDDSSSTGQFADGAISHARLGGPYFVTPVKNGGSALQGATLDTYIEHEMAHMFWALDEHLPSSGWWACSLKTGYLNVQNSNSLVPAAGYCGTPPVQCLMKGNYPDGLCTFTEGQVGWADGDQNGVPDLIDTHPACFPDSDQVSALAGASIHLHGHALEIPLGNQNPNEFFAGDSISIATIDSVRYSIDGGPMVPVPAQDGAYDSGREYFTATLPPLAPGTYTVDWEAWNSNVRKSVNNRTTTIVVRDPTSPVGMGGDRPSVPGASLRFGPSPSSGTVRFTLRARPGSQGWGLIHDVRGTLVTRWRLVVPSSGIADWNWSARVAGGPLPSGLYFLSLDIDGVLLQRRLVISH